MKSFWLSKAYSLEILLTFDRLPDLNLDNCLPIKLILKGCLEGMNLKVGKNLCCQASIFFLVFPDLACDVSLSWWFKTNGNCETKWRKCAWKKSYERNWGPKSTCYNNRSSSYAAARLRISSGLTSSESELWTAVTLAWRYEGRCSCGISFLMRLKVLPPGIGFSTSAACEVCLTKGDLNKKWGYL